MTPATERMVEKLRGVADHEANRPAAPHREPADPPPPGFGADAVVRLDVRDQLVDHDRFAHDAGRRVVDVAARDPAIRHHEDHRAGQPGLDGAMERRRRPDVPLAPAPAVEPVDDRVGCPLSLLVVRREVDRVADLAPHRAALEGSVLDPGGGGGRGVDPPDVVHPDGFAPRCLPRDGGGQDEEYREGCGRCRQDFHGTGDATRGGGSPQGGRSAGPPRLCIGESLLSSVRAGPSVGFVEEVRHCRRA